MKKYSTYSCIMITMVMVTGCVKTYKIPRKELPQAEPRERHDDLIARNVRSIALYHEYGQLAHFDALWFNEQMQQAHTTLFYAKRGKLEREVHTRSQYRHATTFYILAELSTTLRTLNDPHSDWTVYLELPDGELLSPTELKEIELEPEIKHFFDHRYSVHKTAYRVTFAAHDKQLESGEEPFHLVFTSSEHQTKLSWNQHEHLTKQHAHTQSYIKVNPDQPSKTYKKKDEDFYWG